VFFRVYFSHSEEALVLNYCPPGETQQSFEYLIQWNERGEELIIFHVFVCLSLIIYLDKEAIDVMFVHRLKPYIKINLLGCVREV
jgi:hypothetical protein